VSPEEAKAFAGALVAEAKRLGLTWSIRPATVFTAETGSLVATGIFDGDNTNVPMINLLGADIGDRVYVIQIPQGGNYIFGSSAPTGLIAQVDSATNSAAVGAEAVVLTLPTTVFLNERAYRARFRGGTLSSGANGFVYRIRQTSVAGTILHVTQDLGNTTGVSMFDEMVMVRTAGSDLVDNLVLTLQALAGTVTMLGNASFVRYFELENAGPSSRYTNRIAI